jgi:hypothetical protein
MTALGPGMAGLADALSEVSLDWRKRGRGMADLRVMVAGFPTWLAEVFRHGGGLHRHRGGFWWRGSASAPLRWRCRRRFWRNPRDAWRWSCCRSPPIASYDPPARRTIPPRWRNASASTRQETAITRQGTAKDARDSAGTHQHSATTGQHSARTDEELRQSARDTANPAARSATIRQGTAIVPPTFRHPAR